MVERLMPSVTVIIPVYNRETYITHAINSVLNQSFKHWKLLIIDDASYDRTAEIISPYLKDHRIHYKCLPENRGVGFAINTALSIIDSPYFVVLDSDDWLAPKALEKLFNEMQKQPKSTSLVYGNMVVWEESGTKLTKIEVRKFKSFTEKYDFMLYHHMPCPRFFRTETVRQVGGIPMNIPHQGRFAEDRCLLLKLIGISRFHWIDKNLYHARRHGGNTSNNENKKKFSEVRRYIVTKLLQEWGDEYKPVFCLSNGWLNVKKLIKKDGSILENLYLPMENKNKGRKKEHKG